MEVKKTTVEKVRELAQPIADELGFKTVNLDNYCGYAEMGEGEEIIGIAYRQGRRHRYGRLRGFHKTDEQGS